MTRAASAPTAPVRELVTRAAPGLDPDTLEYVVGYFDDASNDVSVDGLMDFLLPLLADAAPAGRTARPPSDADVLALCREISALLGGSGGADGAETGLASTASGGGGGGGGARKLAASVQMDSLMSRTLETTAVGDIRHIMSKAGPQQTTVDQKKLRKAELKLASKRAERGARQEYEIPVWNPNVRPSMIVNQARAPTAAAEAGRSKDVRVENFDISFAGRKILTNADLSMNFGRRYGLVGKNGIGKSTLLRAIAHGELRVPTHIRILHVEQEVVTSSPFIAGDDTPALMSVLQADEERESLLKEEKSLNSSLQKSSTSPEDAASMSERLKFVYQKLEEIEADKAESRASSILSGLGFSPAQQEAATRTFSGGWRMRLALARALFCKPDLLLADEVTNYLEWVEMSFPAVVWLENYFQNWPSTLLVVSHDKSFLDAVSTDILHLHDGVLDYYKGNFSSYVTARAERRKNQIREYEAQLQYRQHLQAFIDRWRYNANRAAQAQSKIKILEKLPELIAPPKDDMDGLGEGEGKEMYFHFPEPEKLSPPILQMDEVTFAYPGTTRVILSGISFDLRMDSKIAVVGPNGAGKSTMIYLLTGQHQPTTGLCNRHGRLRLGLFSQHFVDQLELAESPAQFLAKKFPGKTEEEYRRVLGRFGLTGMTALQPIGTLSGGQKSRVVFASMALTNPH
ncbi:hypothetical protein HK405_008747, partial [Cladochytrium tenue]